MRIFGVSPFIKLQCDTWTTVNRWTMINNEMERILPSTGHEKTQLNQKQISVLVLRLNLSLFFSVRVWVCLCVQWCMCVCMLRHLEWKKGIAPKIHMLCFVLINSVLLNLLRLRSYNTTKQQQQKSVFPPVLQFLTKPLKNQLNYLDN